MSKIILGNLIRHLITLLIGFFVARNMLSQDVAAKLYAGDTVELWGGAWSVSIKQVVDFLMVAVIPALLPVLWGAWKRVKDKYKLIVARLTPETMTNTEVQAVVSKTSPIEIVATVVSKP
jgi:hypothetical protein